MGYIVVGLVIACLFLLQKLAKAEHSLRESRVREHFGMSLENFKLHSGVREEDIDAVLTTPRLRGEVMASMREAWGPPNGA